MLIQNVLTVIYVELAPQNFTDHEDGYSYVYKQPENQAEADECAEALDQCPVEAIGADGN